MTTWLLLDCHYLCHRAFHHTKELEFKGKATGAIFGFLKSISQLKDVFQTDNVVFCFESKHLFRRDIDSFYKHRKRTMTEQEEKEHQELAVQISELRQRYLPKIGFRNIVCYRGYESDDTMAAIAYSMQRDEEEAVIVSADSDMWQCLRPNVRIYQPADRKVLTDDWMRKNYGVSPRQWAVVKAMAGCNSDNVPGIKGVGTKTAIAYLKGELKTSSKIYNRIRSPESARVVQHNRQLVELPFKGCPLPKLEQDEVTKAKWLEVCEMLGMKSIRTHPPLAPRNLGKA